MRTTMMKWRRWGGWGWHDDNGEKDNDDDDDDEDDGGALRLREVNKNNLLGGQFLIFLPKKSRKIINWVGKLKFLSAVT